MIFSENKFLKDLNAMLTLFAGLENIDVILYYICK